MKRKDFLRLFKTNEEAWRLMFMHAKQTEKRTLQACSNFVGVCNSAKITRDETVNVLKFNAAKAKANITERQRV